MKKIILALIILSFSTMLRAQIAPTSSPYNGNGIYPIVSDSDMTAISKPLLFYRPATSLGGPFPVFMFQLGANGVGSTAINRHTYDIYMKHLASYGFVVIVIDDSQAGMPNGTTFKAAHTWYKEKVIENGHWLKTYADPSKFICGGHSNGGVNACALLVDRPTEVHGIVFFASYPSTGILGIGAHNVSGYTGKVLDLAGSEDDSSTPTACKDGYNKFTAAGCRTWVLVEGMGHGGFGDYVNTSQPVGTIGRTDATATVRHYLVSFMLGQFKNDANANSNFLQANKRPNTTGEFESTCTGGTVVVDEINGIENLSIYPNPTSEYFNITSNVSGNLIVTNYVGEEIINRIVEKGNEYQINISQYPSGLYTIVFRTEINLFTRKIIFQK